MATYTNTGWPTSIVGTYDLATTEVDTNYADHAVRVINDGIVTLSVSPSQPECWFHTHMTRTSISADNGADYSPITIYNTNGDILLSMPVTDNGAIMQIYYLDGGSLQLSNRTVITSPGVISIFDFHIKIDNTGLGSIEIYHDNSFVVSITGLSNGTFNVDRCELRSTHHASGANGNTRVSYYGFLVGMDAISSTVGKKVYCKVPTADSTYTAWTGTFAEIDEGLGPDDGLVISTNTTATRQSMSAPAITGTSIPIYNVGILSRASNDGAGILDYQHSYRISATDYDLGVLGTTGTIATQQTSSLTNPATGVDWTLTDFNGTEFGVISS